MRANLVVVGTGIKTISHLTVEAKAYIQQCDKVLFLVNEEILKTWIVKNAKSSENLDGLYFKYPQRIDCYRAITEYILDSLHDNVNLGVILYGHPTVFATPALEAARIAAKRGIDVTILPGISAEDCLFADLKIDPSEFGCQSFEATSFLRSKYIFDRRCHLVIWQPGVINLSGHLIFDKEFNPKEGLGKLCRYLLNHYPKEHKIIIYQAAQLPHSKPTIRSLELAELPLGDVCAKDTLYIPPYLNK